ncbi:hypothetical protein Mycch_3314 [Mycolicibacterium chubuense NBB4]|uniref:Uncharacterized protein n=1 Tax=Mycolicibacterium chubuense (strain NBB4) TaxID=710421 RepID=I4BLA1_MYCCN|nr:hypothetical protein [Mycolicibacterium chubuense]AFM18058.1 hypothetical protein Mycch_3314 [Mycolicibacterium chubuense NBB4]
MTHSDMDGRIAAELPELERRVERARQGAQKAQLSAAAALQASAESHERTAEIYDKLAELGLLADVKDHAARHRKFAEDDRRMAARSVSSVHEHLGGRAPTGSPEP